MLEFEQVITAESSEKASVYVFVDKEKGHTVYLSLNGTLAVVQEEINKKNNIKVAGFLNTDSSCSDCSGC